MKEKVLFIIYSIFIFCLFLYSFTQIDLGLVVSRFPSLYAIEKSFQYIGYFARPLSTYLYAGILVILFLFYGIFLFFASKKKLSKTFIWTTIITTTVLLVFSYSAFSYDIFNYIFDAKIFTHYHQNPYQHKALDYPGDPMLGFMHWTHRVYPYGPTWLGVTVPLSFLGGQIFLVTFFLFKFLMAGFFLLTVYFIGKILQKTAPDNELFGIVFFAFNPLVLIESLVSAHLDIVMMGPLLAAFYLLLKKRYYKSYLLFIFSIGIKFVTGFLIPVFFIVHLLQLRGKKVSWDFIFGISLVLLFIAVFFESKLTNFQPWYLLALLPLAAFLSQRYFVVIPSFVISLIALVNYAPYLYTGNWNNPIPQIIADMNFFSYCLSFFLVTIFFGYKQILFAKNHRKQKKK